MFNIILAVLLLLNSDCTYLEIEGVSETSTMGSFLKSETKSGKFYWFEWLNEIYLFYYENNQKAHRTPFLLFVVIPDARNRHWPYTENYRLLEKAFDDFHQTSAFVSLLPNTQNRNFYSFLVVINSNLVCGLVKVDDSLVFMSENFTLTTLTNHTNILTDFKLGTLSSRRFYESNNKFYGLFMEVYYVIYKDQNEKLESVFLFRTGSLIEIALVSFKTYFTKGKIFLEDRDGVFEFRFIKNIKPREKNTYILRVFHPVRFITVYFDLKENKSKQFEFYFAYIFNLENNIARPKFEKLFQTGKNIFFFESDFKAAHTIEIEIPSYFIAQKLDVSKLIVPFKIIQKKAGKVYMVDVHFLKYNFVEKKNIYRFNSKIFYYLHFGYFVEINKLFFVITKITNSNKEPTNLKQIASVESYDKTERTRFDMFLSGTIIYYQDSVVILEPNEVYTKEFKIKPVMKDESKQSYDKNNITVICLLVGLVLVGICFASKWLFHIFKKKLSKRRKLNKNKSR